ncbi:MAG: hypothetical protein LBR19_05440 [Bifidobacteriaceae bacterium]|jgi:hypothetical protein|nr:hypothetical protein [Bifidobacteriaceae bacterium]
MFDIASGETAAREALANPATPAEDLATIAGHFSSLTPLVAAHPNLYPDLATWLKNLGNPLVDAALGAREAREAKEAPAQAAAQPAPEQALAQAWPPEAQAQPAQGAPQGYPPELAPAYQAPGAYQPPAQPYPQQPPAQYAQAPKAKGGKGKLIMIIAIVVVLALAAAAVWFFFLRDKGGSSSTSTSGRLVAADLAEEPDLGDEIVAGDLLEGDFREVKFSTWIDDGHVSVFGVPGLVLDDDDELQADGDSAVGLVDVLKGELSWQVDLAEVTGWDAVTVDAIAADFEGAMVVKTSNALDSDDDPQLVAISASGEVLGVREGGSVGAARGGYVVINDDGELTGVKTSEFEDDIWTADTLNSSNTSIYSTTYDGAFYALTEDGLVDVKTGDPLGIGDDADEEDLSYHAMEGGVILRCEDAGDDGWAAMLLSASSGDELWDDEVEGASCTYTQHLDGIVLLFGYDDDRLHGYDDATGEEVWKTKIKDRAWMGQLPNGRAAVDSGRTTNDDGYPVVTVSIVEPKTGEILVEVDNVDAAWILAGQKTIYSRLGDEFAAYSIDPDGDGEELWAMELDADLADDDIAMNGRGGRLWLHITTYEQVEDAYGDTIEVAETDTIWQMVN